MNYNSIRDKIEELRFAFKDIAIGIGLTPQGLYKALAKRTLRIDHLEKISDVIGVPMNYWWQDDKTGKVGDFDQLYGNKLVDSLEKNIKMYEKQLEEKQLTINKLEADKNMLMITIDNLQGKLGLSKASSSD